MARRRKKKILTKKQRLRMNLENYLKWGISRGLKSHYTDKQLRIKKFFYLMGGTDAVMKALGVGSFTTLSKWVEREAIPPKYYKKISMALEGKLSTGDIAKILISD